MPATASRAASFSLGIALSVGATVKRHDLRHADERFEVRQAEDEPPGRLECLDERVPSHPTGAVNHRHRCNTGRFGSSGDVRDPGGLVAGGATIVRAFRLDGDPRVLNAR